MGAYILRSAAGMLLTRWGDVSVKTLHENYAPPELTNSHALWEHGETKSRIKAYILRSSGGTQRTCFYLQRPLKLWRRAVLRPAASMYDQRPIDSVGGNFYRAARPFPPDDAHHFSKFLKISENFVPKNPEKNGEKLMRL